MCIYHKDHLSGLRMKNTSESDLHSYEVTYINKAQKDSNGIRTHESRPSASSICTRYMKRMRWCAYHKADHTSGLRMKNTSESDPHSYEVT